MSFNEQDICNYIKKHQLSLDTADYIRRSARSLARDVGQAPGRPSMLIEHCSEKMGCTVNSESYLEHSYALELEFDDDVIAFYEQPATVECLRGEGNNPRPFPYTPDFLVLRTEGPQVIQIKHEKDLVRLAEQRSYWQKTETGYVDESAAATFATIGLQHRVVSSQDLSKLRTQNSRLIAQASAADVSAEATRGIRTALKTRKVCLMSQLLMDAKTDDVTAIVQLIHKRELFVRLDQHSLSSPATCVVATDPKLLCDEVLSEFKPVTYSPAATNDIVDITRLPPSRHIEHALSRLRLLDSLPKTKSEREQIRRLKRLLNDGIALGLSPIASLTPKYSLSGNRKMKRPAHVMEYARAELRRIYESDIKPSIASTIRRYKAHAERQHPGFMPVSDRTARKILEDMDQEMAEARGGKRYKNAKAPPSTTDQRSLKAVRPFEITQCDHYLADIDVVVGEANGRKCTARPWVTMLVDCFSQVVLCFWMSLRAPTKGTASQVLRECVRRHGRVPETIITDNGSDFRSVHYSAMAAALRITIMFRPPGNGRYGCEVERLFGQAKSFWLDALPGSTPTIRFSRAVSAKHKAHALAKLSLTDLWEELEAFIEWVSLRQVGDSERSPGIRLEDGLRRFPFSGHRTELNTEVLVATSMPSRFLKVSAKGGIHSKHYHHWHDSLSSVNGKKVEVRIDSQDPRIAYAAVGGRWIVCKAYASLQSTNQTHAEAMAMGIWLNDADETRKQMKDAAEVSLVSGMDIRNEARIERKHAVVGASQTTPAITHQQAASVFSDPAAFQLESMPVEDWK